MSETPGSSIDDKQKDLESKLTTGEEKLGKKILGNDNYNYFRDVYSSQVDEFQKMEKDPELALNESPSANKHFNDGLEIIKNILISAVQEGVHLSKNLEDRDRITAVEVLHLLAKDLSREMAPYKEELKEISTTERAISEVKKNQEAILAQPNMRSISNTPLSAIMGKSADDGIKLCGKAKNYLNTYTRLSPEFKQKNLEYVNSQIPIFTNILAYQAMHELIVKNKWEKYISITVLLETDSMTTERTTEFSKLPETEKENINNILGLAKLSVETIATIATAPPIMQNYFLGLQLFHQGDLKGAKKHLEQFCKRDVWSKKLEKNPDYWNHREELHAEAMDVLQQIEEKSSPILQNYLIGLALFKQGKLESAKEYLKKFKVDVWSMEMEKQLPNYWAKREELSNEVDETIIEIDRLLEDHAEYFKAQNLANSGEIIAAKVILLKYVNSKYASTDKETQKYVKAAKVLLERIAMAQLAELRQKFELIPLVEGQYYQNELNQLNELERWIKRTSAPDLNVIIADRFPDLEEGHLLLDVAIESTGKAGLLKLARKYREMGQPAIAREYYKKYFTSQLTNTAKKSVTVESIRKEYDADNTFHSAVNEKLEEVKDKYKELYGKDWEEMYGKAGGDVKFQHEIENQAISKIYLQKVMDRQQMDLASIPEADLPIWNEFAKMEGVASRTIGGFETVKISDAEMTKLIDEIAVMVIITAVSAGAASLAAAVVARGIVLAAGRIGMSHGMTVFTAATGGFAAESLIFSSSSVSLNAINDGNFCLNTFGEGVTSDIDHGTAVLGMFKGIGFIGKSFGRGSTVAARAASGAGRGSKVAKGLVYAHGLSTEMIGMGIVEGKLTAEAALMALGLRVAHSKTVEDLSRTSRNRTQENLAAIRQRDSLRRDIIKAKREGMTPNAIFILEQRLKVFERSLRGKPGGKPINPEQIKTARITENGKILINGKESGYNIASLNELPINVRLRIIELAPQNALNTHFFSRFSSIADIPPQLLADPSKPATDPVNIEAARNLKGWIDKNGNIHYNRDFLNTYGESSERLMPEGYKFDINAKGEPIIRTKDGKIMAYDEYQKSIKNTPYEGRLSAMLFVIKVHESTHQVLEFGFTTEFIGINGQTFRVVDGNKTKTLLELFEKPNSQGVVEPGKLKLVDIRGKPMDVTFENVQEYLSHVADGSIPASKEQVKAIEKVLNKVLPDFSFQKSIQYATRLIAQNHGRAFERKKPAPFSTILPTIKPESTMVMSVDQIVSLIREGAQIPKDAISKILEQNPEAALEMIHIKGLTLTREQQAGLVETIFTIGEIQGEGKRIAMIQKALKTGVLSYATVGEQLMTFKEGQIYLYEQLKSRNLKEISDFETKVIETLIKDNSFLEKMIKDLSEGALPPELESTIRQRVERQQQILSDGEIIVVAGTIDQKALRESIGKNIKEGLTNGQSEVCQVLSRLKQRDPLGYKIIEAMHGTLSMDYVRAVIEGRTIEYTDKAGRKIRAYQNGPLGKGTFGTVSNAMFSVDGSPNMQTAAIKFPHEHTRLEFKLEIAGAEIVQNWNDPNINRPLSIGENCILFETGTNPKSFKEELKNASPKEQIKLIRDVISGLRRYQKEGYFHGDIKPENILVIDSPEGRRAIIIDNNPVKASKNSSTLMNGGWHITPRYSAEVDFSFVRNDPVNNFYTVDNFALGTVLGETVNTSYMTPFETKMLNKLIEATSQDTGERGARLLSNLDGILGDIHKRLSSQPEHVKEPEKTSNEPIYGSSGTIL